MAYGGCQEYGVFAPVIFVSRHGHESCSPPILGRKIAYDGANPRFGREFSCESKGNPCRRRTHADTEAGLTRWESRQPRTAADPTGRCCSPFRVISCGDCLSREPEM